MTTADWWALGIVAVVAYVSGWLMTAYRDRRTRR